MRGISIIMWSFSGMAVVTPALGMTLSGPVSAISVTVSGDVTLSSMTASTAIVTSQLNVTGSSIQVPGRIVQMKFSSSTVTTSVSTTTWTAVANVVGSITPQNANDYIRISLTGNLVNSSVGFQYAAYLTIYRDSTNLGDSSLGLTATQNGSGADLWIDPVGLTIKDSPGDTNSHTYQAYIRGDNIGGANFPQYSIAYLLIEEISQ